jgi:hypothetical protein
MPIFLHVEVGVPQMTKGAKSSCLNCLLPQLARQPWTCRLALILFGHFCHGVSQYMDPQPDYPFSFESQTVLLVCVWASSLHLPFSVLLWMKKMAVSVVPDIHRPFPCTFWTRLGVLGQARGQKQCSDRDLPPYYVFCLPASLAQQLETQRAEVAEEPRRSGDIADSDTGKGRIRVASRGGRNYQAEAAATQMGSIVEDIVRETAGQVARDYSNSRSPYYLGLSHIYR